MEAEAVSRVIPANEYRRVRWRNDAGWTREIVAWPAAPAWDWRLSIAEIERPAPYSAFPGTLRQQLLLRGDGLALDFGDGGAVHLAPPHGRIRFDGGRPPDAVPAGRVEAFNLMWRPDAVDAELWHRPLVGPMLFFAEPGVAWALHLIGGEARFAADAGLPRLARGDTAVLVAASRRRFLLEGGGELLAVRLRGIGAAGGRRPAGGAPGSPPA